MAIHAALFFLSLLLTMSVSMATTTSVSRATSIRASANGMLDGSQTSASVVKAPEPHCGRCRAFLYHGLG